MLLVANRHGERVFNPNQLRDLCGEMFSDEEMMGALTEVRSALAIFQSERGTPVDRIVKNREFTDALLAPFAAPTRQPSERLS